MVNRTIKIRRANAGDADLIALLSKITFEDTFKGTCTDEDMQAFVETAFSLSLIQVVVVCCARAQNVATSKTIKIPTTLFTTVTSGQFFDKSRELTS